MSSRPRRRALPALSAAVAGALLLAGCGSDDKQPAAEGSAPAIPFSAAGSIAAPEHAAVERAFQALAAAELRMYQDIAPLRDSSLDTFLRGLAGASDSTRQTIERIASRGGNCRAVGTAVSAASAGVTRQLDAAMARFSGQISLAEQNLDKIAADRAAVAKAAANLKAALAADPTAWRIPGVDVSGSSLTAIAKWQVSLADAISAARTKAKSYDAIRYQVFSRAAGVSGSCTKATARARTRPASTATRSTTPVSQFTSPAPGSSSPPRTASTPSTPVFTTAAVPTPSSTTPSPTFTTPAATPTPTPTPTTTTPAPTFTSPTAAPSSSAATPSDSTSDSPSESPSPTGS